MINFSKRSNIKSFSLLAVFLLAFVVTGCTKTAPPLEAEAPPETPVETVVQEETPVVEEEAPLVQEQVEEIALEEMAPVVEETQEQTPVVEEQVQAEVIEEVPVSEELKLDSAEKMDMGDNTFVAEGLQQEETPVQNTEVFVPAEETPVGQEIVEVPVIEFTAPPAIEDVYFDFDKYDLSQEYQDKLRANAQWLKANPNAVVEIEGHCDERGSNNYNLALGEQRAKAAKNFLIAEGVGSNQVKTISYGEEKPFCFQSDESCWWQNRRAHFQVK